MKKNAPKVREVYVRTDDGGEEPSHYISATALVCGLAILAFAVFVLIIELLIGWGPIFKKLFEVWGISW